MGILDRLGLGKRTVDMLGITTPYAPHIDLPPFVITDILSEEEVSKLPMTRAEAITIPAVSKARNLLVSTIAKFPLRALDKNGVVKEQAPFLYRTSSTVTPLERMAWTVDDLIFYGYSLWLVERGTRSGDDNRRPILNAEWCPTSRWTITDGHILVDEEDVPDENVILFNSPFEGLLNIGGRTLKGARDQEASWVGRARNPIPLIELHQVDDSLDEKEVKTFVDAWATARKQENGAIGYTPPSLQINTHGEVHADLMIEGRNAVRTDIGSFLNIRASMLDGTQGIDSLTYTTNEGEKNSFYEFDLPFWTDPIEARLSMDDVVPRGQRVRFDKYDAYHLPTPTGPIVED